MTTDRGIDALTGRSDLWSLREDVYVEVDPSGGPARVYSRWGEVTIKRPSSPVREALHRMSLGPISLENVISERDGAPPSVASSGPPDPGSPATQRKQLDRVLERLQPLIVRTLGFGSGLPLLSVVPLTPQARFRPELLPPDTQVRLSAFAELRTDGREYRLESPLALHRVLFHRAEAMWLIALLGRPVTVAACTDALPQLNAVATEALAYLAAAGMVVRGEEAPGGPGHPLAVFAEDTDPALVGWSPVDLMFHTRRTTGRHDNAIGITYPLGQAGSPEPVVKPPRAGEAIPLSRPSWEDLSVRDPPLVVAMEGRHSMRLHGAEPVTADELGYLLYRTARVRSLITPSSAGPSPFRPEGADGGAEPGAAQGDTWVDPRLSDRPYPGGGACYELELYLTIGNCSGIAAGIYHYDSLGHRLEPVNADRATVDGLLMSAREAAAMEIPPPVLITMTARCRRLSWKYEGLAYAVMLMDVGVLIQSLYLVCTAMRLAPCAIGSVRADATAHAFGTDWRLEPSVGQFIVGRDPDADVTYAGRWQPVNDAQWSDLARARIRGLGTSSS